MFKGLNASYKEVIFFAVQKVLRHHLKEMAF